MLKCLGYLKPYPAVASPQVKVFGSALMNDYFNKLRRISRPKARLKRLVRLE